jgi:hypothetical protein
MAKNGTDDRHQRWAEQREAHKQRAKERSPEELREDVERLLVADLEARARSGAIWGLVDARMKVAMMAKAWAERAMSEEY